MDFLILKALLFKGVAVAIGFDFATGVLAAWKYKKLESKVCADGLFRTFGECIYLSLLLFIGKIFPSVDIILIVLLLSFIVKEGISLSENFKKLKVPIPKWIDVGLKICDDKIDSIDIKEIKEKMEDKL